MKKRTKKKIRKIGIITLKVVFVYPWIGLAKLSRYVVHKIKEKRGIQREKEKEKQRPSIAARYRPLQEIQKQKGNVQDFEKLLLKNSSIGIILGARGSGKSVIGMRLLENVKAQTDKKIFAMGFSAEDLPRWITVVENIHEINNNALVLIDEGGITFSSRKSMSDANKILSELLLIARHKDLSVLFITQNSANLEVNAIRQADYLILKPSSLLQRDFERKKIKDLYTSLAEEFNALQGIKGLTYIYANSFQGFVTNELPSFWTESISKSFAHK